MGRYRVALLRRHVPATNELHVACELYIPELEPNRDSPFVAAYQTVILSSCDPVLPFLRPNSAWITIGAL